MSLTFTVYDEQDNPLSENHGTRADAQEWARVNVPGDELVHIDCIFTPSPEAQARIDARCEAIMEDWFAFDAAARWADTEQAF